MFAEDKISSIKNIGETREKQLNKMGVETVEDLLEYFPRDYDDRSTFVSVAELKKGDNASFRARVLTQANLMRRGKMTMVRVGIGDGSGMIEAVWFNQPYMKNTMAMNREFIFTCKIGERNGRLQAENPEVEAVKLDDNLNVGRIVPVYTLPKRLSQKTIRAVIHSALSEMTQQMEDFLPDSVRRENRLCDRAYAIRNIHFPESDDAFFVARRRLVFEELFMLQLKLFQLKGNVSRKKSSVTIVDDDISPLRNVLGFNLTDAQERVLGEIYADMKSGSEMNRLIQGDVGCGKTAVAMLAAFGVIKNGYQAVLMAPTDVLANQHYKSISETFSKLGINCTLLTSGIKKKEKTAAYIDIKSGMAQMIIGTHALIQEAVVYNKLGLVITDEQHRFGVRQRQMLSDKGENPHTLVMTATPIPRTLALILYGDLDISTIDTLPPGRQKVDTFAVDHSYDQRLYAFIKKEAAKGRQAYVICPMIEENDKLELRAVENYTLELKENHLRELRVEYVHGKMKNDEKQAIMNEFAKGDIDVLVSTTVIEVGINVPNATLMIIENAERFGLSALHQLRGRVGRGSEKSYCVLVSDSKTKVAKERLKIMCGTNDGFVISEKDLKLRGPGDFFGTRQHGLPEMKIANLYKDIDILKEVRDSAIKLLSADYELKNAENIKLKKKIEDIFEKNGEKVCL